MSLTIKISKEEINFFKNKAEEKIKAEHWTGRDHQTKINNFLNCWITEEAFKKILAEKNIWFRHRGLYVGDAQGAGHDFQVKINQEIKSIGIRSISQSCYQKWKVVPYPDDRFLEEKEKIADYIVATHFDGENTHLLGYLEKNKFLKLLEKSEVKFSKHNQEYFRTIPISSFLPLQTNPESSSHADAQSSNVQQPSSSAQQSSSFFDLFDQQI